MRIIFVTRREHDVETTLQTEYVTDSLGRKFPIESLYQDITVEITDSLDGYHEMMKNGDIFGLDTENTDLNHIYATPLLLQMAIMDLSYVIDQTSVHEDFLSLYTNKLFVGQNIQYDHRIIRRHNKVDLINLEDIMVTEQILGRGSGRLNNMEDIYLRRCNKHLPVEKQTRKDFTRMSNKSRMKTRHIVYSGYDPKVGLEVREVQKPLVEQYKLGFRTHYIGMGCIPVIGEMCDNGTNLNVPSWKVILDKNKLSKFKIECELDAIIAKFAINHLELRHGKWSRKRRKEDGEQISLFGENKSVATLSNHNISYNSAPTLKYLFGTLGEPIPQMKKKKEKNGPKVMVDSFAEEAIEQYKIIYPHTRMKEFLNKLLDYKEVEKEINSFGESFIKEFVQDGKKAKKLKRGYYNRITNRIHTIYKQEFTKNGRLASGEGRKSKDSIGIGFYNSQQWPKKNEFRNCVCLTQREIDEGYWMSTTDLSSAEGVILASLSQDPALIANVRNDLHSYLATFAYNEIISYIFAEMKGDRVYDELYALMKVNRLKKELKKQVGIDNLGHPIFIYLTPEEEHKITVDRVDKIFQDHRVTINKKIFPDIREPYKNCTYAVYYGATDFRVAETLNIAKHYANLIIKGVEKATPKAFRFLDQISKSGVKNGYVVFNNRTNSRHWFKTWLDAKTWGKDLTFTERGDIERFCKNAVMSGTQADMIKEGMVDINRFVKKEKIDFKWLLQVHDEIVTMHKDKDLRLTTDKMLVDACNRYLTGIEMEVAGYTGHWWHK